MRALVPILFLLTLAWVAHALAPGDTYPAGPYPSTPGSTVVEPIFTMDFEGGTSDCTDAGHCSNETICATSDLASVNCNATADPSPAGGAYMSFDGAQNGNISFSDQFSAHELWWKMYWYFEDPNVTQDFINLYESGTTNPGCGLWRQDMLVTSDFRARACGAAGDSTGDLVGAGVWEEVKFRFDVSTGIADVWFAGSDFSDSPDLTVNGSGSVEAEPDPFEGFRLRNVTSGYEFRVDAIRIYDQDPDA